jgi:hypothetical protein
MKPAHLVFIIILATISVACSSLEPQSTPTGILFSDDFSSIESDWDQFSDATYTADYYIGAYRITVNMISTNVWANPGNESFTDVRVEVDATMNGGPEDNEFGVICRYIDEDQFYYGAISSDGYYGIVKMTKDGGFLVGDDSMLESSKISQGAAANHIRFDCIGSTLSLYVNGSLVVQQTDSAYTVGNTGLIAGTFDTPGTDILFDNLVVYKP